MQIPSKRMKESYTMNKNQKDHIIIYLKASSALVGFPELSKAPKV